MKIHHMSVCGAVLTVCALFNGSVHEAKAATRTFIYAPDTEAEVRNPNWNTYPITPNTRWAAGIWGFHNASFSSVTTSGKSTPLRITNTLYDQTKGHWNVIYGIGKDMLPSNVEPAFWTWNKETQSWYREHYWFKAYPRATHTPQIITDIYHGQTRNYTSTWHYGAESTNWKHNLFQNIWEIRLAKYDANGNVVPSTEVFVQIEVLRSQTGNDGAPNITINNRAWVVGKFYTADDSKGKPIPVHTFTLAGSKVSSDVDGRTTSVNFFPFLQHLAFNNMERVTWNHRIQEISAGVEIGRGEWPTKNWTGSYTINLTNK